MRPKHLVAGLLFVVAAMASARATDPVPHAQWPTLLLASPAAITVPPPPDAAATRAELDRMRANLAGRPEDLALRLRRWDAGGAPYRWNQAAVAALVNRGMTMPPSSRALALLHAALHDTSVVVWTARAAHARAAPGTQDPTLALVGATMPQSSYPSETAALNAAAAAVLSALIPAEAEAFAALAAEGVALRQQAGQEFPSDAAAGHAIGEAVAALALARAKDDGFARPWTGTVPTGPGRWTGTNPITPLAGTWRAWLLPTNDALRPPPPPAFDSPETLAALAELKNYPRTPKSNDVVQFWGVYGGTRGYQIWHAELARKVLEYGLAANPARLAAVHATFAVAYADSYIACFEAKYAYWYIRPHQLDPTLTTVISVPGHPSYPAAHSCLSMAAATVLAALFPLDAPQLMAAAEEAGEARVAGGIHYRFDVVAGQEIGRRAAALALAKMAPALR